MDKPAPDQVHIKDNHYVDEGYCQDNDLILAVELGKALLERNSFLEDALQAAQNAEKERTSEIKFLQRQVTELRKIGSDKAHWVEEAEHYYQDLESKNYQLVQERLVDRERIHRLSTRVKQLEEQLHQLNDETSEDGQPQQQQQQQQSSEPACRPASRCSQTPLRPNSRDVRSGFIDDEFYDQPELLTVVTPTDSDPCHLTLDVPSRQPRRRRESWSACEQVGGPKAFRFPSHPPAASRCCRVASPCEPTDSLHHQPVYQRGQETRSAPLETESSSCPHDCRSDEFDCLNCFDSSREAKELKAVFHGAAVMRELDRIYDAQLQCQLKALRVGCDDREPAYHQLFAEAFQMLRKLKRQVKP